MTDLAIFRYEGADVRTVTIDGEPWFVLADLTRALGIAQFRTDRLSDDLIRNHPIADRIGRSQMVVLVSEPGMYEVVIRSDKPEAAAFRAWITREVLPSIRRTGAYAVETPEQLLARALVTAQGVIERKDEHIAALTPRAEAWDELASAVGDYDVADAAKILARAGVETGRTRLFTQLADLRWIHRGHHGKWVAYQSAVDDGYLTERPQSHHHPRTGDLVLDPPQVRVTVRGLERLRIRLGTLALTG
ncbi:phage antirepressor KilAC domain-containing protein [Microbacterium lacticum]|uniref:phage antirepressor KilAC domain-containing protein n=1 Tax=Microbacterium lacticum TaxID=33885 RepID=UPI001F57C7F5|nr:phage antirepressor KilAC domain-containing protein [Microbacterium lacticum]